MPPPFPFDRARRLMLGKCHLQLNERAAAAEWFERALELPTNTVDDEQAITEARRMLNETRR
jgi:Tfp pilus assembly protein PilF